MAHRRHDRVVAPEEPGDGPGLGGALHDDERLGHVFQRYVTEPGPVNCRTCDCRYPSGGMARARHRRTRGGDAARRALKALDTTAKVTTALGRPDLARELGLVRERLLDPAFTVLVIGEFKQGKSSLVNALLGAAVCPVDDDVATAVPTVLRWSDAWTAAVYHAPESPDDDLEATCASRCPSTRWRATSPRRPTPRTSSAVRSVELGVPAPLLQGGLVLVDTPGRRRARRRSTPPSRSTPCRWPTPCCSSPTPRRSTASRSSSSSTRRRRLCPHVVGVLTKTRLLPGVAQDPRPRPRPPRATASLDFPILTDQLGAASPRRRAAATAALNQESGFPDARALPARRRRRARASASCSTACTRSPTGWSTRSRRSTGPSWRALQDPEVQARRLAELAEAEARAGGPAADARPGGTSPSPTASPTSTATPPTTSTATSAASTRSPTPPSRPSTPPTPARSTSSGSTGGPPSTSPPTTRSCAGGSPSWSARVEAHFVEDGGDSGDVRRRRRRHRHAARRRRPGRRGAGDRPQAATRSAPAWPRSAAPTAG